MGFRFPAHIFLFSLVWSPFSSAHGAAKHDDATSVHPSSLDSTDRASPPLLYGSEDLLFSSAADDVALSKPNPRSLSFDLFLADRRSGRRLAALDADADGSTRTSNNIEPKFYSVTLTNYDNVQYQMEIRLGSRQEPFTVVPDTGSSDIWIPNMNCTSCPLRVHKFDVTQSSTAQFIGDEVDFKYGDGTTAHGRAYKDTIVVGDVTVDGQYFVLVDRMSGTGRMKSDGIFGLAHYYNEEEKTENAQTFLTTIFKRNPELKRQVSIFLTAEVGRNSKLFFGAMDYDVYAKEKPKFGKHHYVKETHLWLTSVWSIGFGGTGEEFSFPQYGLYGAPALVDSGSSLLVFYPSIYDSLMEVMRRYLSNCRKVPGKESIEMCACPPNIHAMPPLAVSMISNENEEFQLCISAEEYVLKSLDPSTGEETCVPSFERGSAKQPVPIILGMTFLRSFVVTMDVDSHRIGFARSIVSPLPAAGRCEAFQYPQLRLGIWYASLGCAIASMGFAGHVLSQKYWFSPSSLISSGEATHQPLTQAA